jgi:hypothetical protein
MDTVVLDQFASGLTDLLDPNHGSSVSRQNHLALHPFDSAAIPALSHELLYP